MLYGVKRKPATVAGFYVTDKSLSLAKLVGMTGFEPATP